MYLIPALLLCSASPAHLHAPVLAQEGQQQAVKQEALPAQGEGPPVIVPPDQRPQGGAAPSNDAFDMGSPPQLPDGLMEEDMWPAASNEGWKKPCLVRWQRSFEDAVTVANAENRPLLVAVNMDGEIASEHFAGVRYREPATAALMEPYVCVIASVYRHTPRDFDENGQRVECPRFGTVTCGEHIHNERQLYDQYFDGKRISPRHIVLDLEGNETYDVYYSWDTRTVFTTFVKGLEGWPEPNEPEDRSLRGMLKSANVVDRLVVEKAYAEGSGAQRHEILDLLTTEREVDQVGVLRKAIFGLDLDLAAKARRALAHCESDPALDLMAEVLKTSIPSEERELILQQVERLGAESKRARTLAALHSGLSAGSRHIAASPDTDRAAEYEANVLRGVDLDARAAAAASAPDPEALLRLAEGLLTQAFETSDDRYRSFLLEDARDAARRASEAGAEGPLMDAVFALSNAWGRQRAQARRAAVRAVEAGLVAEGAPRSELLQGSARARLLLLFADARQRDIRASYRQGGEWPAEWLSDVNAAYSSVFDDPYVTAWHLTGYHDFLGWIGASPRAAAVLDQALERFPDSPDLHERLRARLLYEGGPKGLMDGYEERLTARGEEPGQLTWFAGYAALVAAEHNRRRGEFEEAVSCYSRGDELYRRNVADFPEGAGNANHFRSLGLAGQARLLLESGSLVEGTERILEAILLSPNSAGTPDGLSLTPVQTALMLQARLQDAGDLARARQLQATLDSLDRSVVDFPSGPSAQRGAQRFGSQGGGQSGGGG